MRVSLEEIKFLIDFGQFLLTGAVWLYVYLQNRHMATNDRIEELEDEIKTHLSDHHSRLTRLEGGVRMSDLEKIWEVLRLTQTTLHEIKGRQEAANKLLEEIIKGKLYER